MRVLKERHMSEFFFRKKNQLWTVEQKPAALLFTTGLIWHWVTSCLIPVLQHIQQQCLCESGDKCLHNSNANDSVVLPNVSHH